MPIMLKVEEPPSETESDAGDDISEPDEDTLAGQMAMMRGENVKPSKVHGGEYDSEEDSDDVDDASDAESSSDDEGPTRARAYNEDSSDSD